MGQGTPKQHARAPELRGWALLVDSQAQAIMVGSILQAGPWCPPCKGPSLAARPQGGPGAARPLALRPRPGEPRLPLSTGRPAQTQQGPREHGVISTSIPE